MHGSPILQDKRNKKRKEGASRSIMFQPKKQCHNLIMTLEIDEYNKQDEKLQQEQMPAGDRSLYHTPYTKFQIEQMHSMNKKEDPKRKLAQVQK